MSKQPNMLTWPLLAKSLRYVLGGNLSLRKQYLPAAQHAIPRDFIGVNVATAEDPAMDDYVIAQLNQLGIRQVRMDFSYGDLTSYRVRFLQRLLQAGFSVALHLVQPFASAKRMEDTTEQEQWRAFVTEVVNQYGRQLVSIEIGTTLNRKRWAGYHLPGFLIAWEIAYPIIKQQGVLLAGPNISDFEPFYNIGILNTLKSRSQLPDIHTDNLFSERVWEPEQFDHRISRYGWLTKLLKVNLITKARILNEIGRYFGIQRFTSPVAFWAIYRLGRTWPDSLEKQADYAARYLLLCAASGSLSQVFWGAFICQREGLISDGLSENDYPDLERVAHYANVDGQLENFSVYPSFHAVKTVAALIQGSQYMGARATARGLELHRFRSDQHEIHALWTINGKIAFLDKIYAAETLAAAEIISRDGQALNTTQFVTESVIYLRWPVGYKPQCQETKLAKDLAIHWHINGLQYFRVQTDGWSGMILAKDAGEASRLTETLHPSQLKSPQKSGALRHARNAIWAMPDPRDESRQITVKQPVKMYPHKTLFDRFKPSKAKRSWNGAMELLRRGIDTARPVAFFEMVGDTTLKQNFYLCDFVQADCSVGDMFRHFAVGHKTFTCARGETISATDSYAQVAAYLVNMHKRGVFFRDLSGGNVLVQMQRQPNDTVTLRFSLIDTARARFYNMHTPMNERLSDAARLCHKLHWSGRKRLMGHYLGAGGRQFSWRYQLPFYLYDFKVALKRKIGRKGIKNLVKKLKSLKS